MNIKNNKGFSLIEILVVIGLIGILSVIAIPAYDNYRDTANDTVLKSDAGNAYKAIHAYNAWKHSFCANFASLGLSGLTGSSTYAKSSFVGFAGDLDGCTLKPKHAKDDEGADDSSGNGGFTVTGCKLGSSAFVLGLGNKFGGSFGGYTVTNTNGSPKSSGGSCSSSNAACLDSGQQDETTCKSSACTTADSSAKWIGGKVLCN